MDNEGGDQPVGIDPAAMGAADGGDPGAGQDENVDQYFDDGGETFLPADHVSNLSFHNYYGEDCQLKPPSRSTRLVSSQWMMGFSFKL